MKSDPINDLTAALAKAQAKMQPATKDGKNPHLKNTYATLDSIIETARGPLTENGMSFSQPLQQRENGLVLETWLFHESGQFLQSEVLVTPAAGNRGVNEMQALGSTLTYLKRYALAAMLGISVEEDDDGNRAQAPPKPQKQQKQTASQPNGKQAPAPKKNGHKTPAEELFEAIQALANSYYENVPHLFQTLGQWPDFNDPAAVEEAKQRAIQHAKQKADEKATEDEVPF